MNAKKLLCPLALIALALGLGACATTADSSPATAADAAAPPAAAEPAPLPAEEFVELRAGEYQEGTACVSTSAPTDKCPAQYKGLCRTGRANGCSHDACTAAKNQARANVRAATPAGCHAYIQSNAPCKNGPGC